MKHLEQSQILTIMDCMHPTTVSQGCCVIQEGDDGSLVYVLEGERKGVGCILKMRLVNISSNQPIPSHYNWCLVYPHSTCTLNVGQYYHF